MGGFDEKAFDGTVDDAEHDELSGQDSKDGVKDSASSLIPRPSSLAVCLVSGGMDSCVTAAIAREENAELAFLHVSY